MELNEKLVYTLIEKQLHICFAESCTGGKAASGIVDVADASKVLDMSFVTYSNESKVDLLGVKQETIDKFGVVSEEVAKEMAIGASNKADSDIGVGISGIAGPTGGTATKPIGMVCFGIYYQNKTYTYTKYFGSIGRNNVRDASVEFIYQEIMNIL